MIIEIPSYILIQIVSIIMPSICYSLLLLYFISTRHDKPRVLYRDLIASIVYGTIGTILLIFMTLPTLGILEFRLT